MPTLYEGREEPPTHGEVMRRIDRALELGAMSVRAFERDAHEVSKIDDELYAQARERVKQIGKGDARAIASAWQNESPKRKRLISACQFAIQKANMYHAQVSALADAHL